MDTITQINNKLMAEHNRLPTSIHQATENAPPPPYTDANSDSSSDSDSDDDSDEEPMKLVINANHSVHGSNNLVPTTPSALADATKFSAILLNAINQLNNAAATTATNNAQHPPPRRLRVDLTINCGIAVVGNRNVIGSIGVKPKAPTLTQNGFVSADGRPMAPELERVVAGAKRKAEDEDTDVDAPEAKRLHGDGDAAGSDQLQTPP